jgi:TRAP-type C4-dicarboxylate transport system permease small subunit
LGINVYAFGLGAVFGAGGIGLLALGYRDMNSQEISGGWVLIALAFIMWLMGFAAKESRRRRWKRR